MDTKDTNTNSSPVGIIISISDLNVKVLLDNNHVVIVNRDPEQYACTSIEEDIESLNKLFDWWTQIPYDHYHEWLSETNDTLKRRQK